MEQVIYSKLLDIEASISTKKLSNIGLYNGTMGFALFYCNLYLTTKNEFFLKECHKWITISLENFDQNHDYTFCTGAAGIAWCLDYLRQAGLVDFDKTDFFEEIEIEIYREALSDLSQGKYDFMHGGLGPVLFALRRLPDSNAFSFLEEAVRLLQSTKVNDNDGNIKWEDKLNDYPGDEKFFDLGLSHGLPSIINILLRVYDRGILKEETANLISGSIKTILSSKLKDINVRSIYPNRLASGNVNSEGFSRLAWCYGDLGIAWTLLQASIVLKSESYLSEAMTILYASLKRRDPLEDHNLDAGFCHGTSGIAYFFKKFYEKTGIIECSKMCDFWKQETIKLARFSDGLGGYKFYHQPSKAWVLNSNLLEGVCGVGLVLGCEIEEETNWDECFLISF